MAQTISAAFGPIGIYSILQHFLENRGRIPRFLGIQQEANCPMYKAWKSKSKELERRPPQSSLDQPLLTRVMYDVAPYTYGTYGDLRDVLTACRGDLTTISRSEFFSFLEQDFDGRSLFDFLSERALTSRKGMAK